MGTFGHLSIGVLVDQCQVTAQGGTVIYRSRGDGLLIRAGAPTPFDCRHVVG